MERFEHFVTANGITDDEQVAVFLSIMGVFTDELLHSLIAPDKMG